MADINRLVDEFHKSGENTISILQKIAAEIGGGYVPSKLEGSEFSDSLFKLRKLYELITGAAEEELNNDEMPAAGSSVHAIIKAVDEKRLRLYKKRVGEIEEAIGSFEKISSTNPLFGSSLEPFQNSAKQLLDRIHTEEMVDLDEYADEIKRIELMLQLIKGTYSLTDEKIVADLETIGKLYSDRVLIGLLTKQYKHSDSELMDDRGVALPDGEYKDLIVYLQKNTDGLSVIKSIEADGKKKPRYNRLILKNLFFIKKNLTIVRADMVVERCYCDYEQSIFFEMLKNANTNSIRSYVQSQFTEELLEEYAESRQMYKLDKPYSLIIPGSKHKYAFTGVYVADLNEKSW